MAIVSIKKLEINCDTCKKVIATGRTTTDVLVAFEAHARFTETFCTDCVKLAVEPLADEQKES